MSTSKKEVAQTYTEYKSCRLCARECGVDRTVGERGFCRSGAVPMLTRASLHRWEEPPISGERGSGTIFFSGCSLGCCFCQNHEISRSEVGKTHTAEELASVMLSLMEQGAHNINFVTPTHFAPHIISAVKIARCRGLNIPIVYNTGSYERAETVRALENIVDIYLADYKFHLTKTASTLARASDYPTVASASIAEMVRLVGAPVIEDGIMKRGVIVRILLLPSHVAEAKLSVKHLYDSFGDDIYLSLMNQYTPIGNQPAPLDRPVTLAEYDELVSYAISKGVKNAFIQEGGTVGESFIPSFDGSGV